MTKRILLFPALFTLSIVFITSCKNKSTSNLEAGFGSFLASNENVAVFGSVNADAIISKSDVLNFPKLGKEISKFKNQFDGSFDGKSPIFLATIAKEEEQAMFFFLKVKNKDSVAFMIKQLGYSLESANGFQFMEEEDVTIGFDDNTAIAIVRKKTMAAKPMLERAFADVNAGKTTNAKMADLIKEKGDIVFNTALGYGTLFGEKGATKATEGMKKLQALAKDSYYSSAINFENGKMTMDIKGLLTDALKARLPFKAAGVGNLSSDMGSGKPRMGLALNLDMDKLNSWMLDFMSDDNGSAFNFKQEYDSYKDGASMLIPGVDMSKLSNILAGNLALLICLEGESYSGGVPQINVNVGFGSEGSKLAEAVESKAFLLGAKKIGENTFNYEGGTYNVSAKGIKGQTAAATGSMQMPVGSESYGTTPISIFANLEGLNIASFGFEDGARVVEIVKYAKMNASGEKGTLEVVVKDPNQNILKQILSYYKDLITAKVSESKS